MSDIFTSQNWPEETEIIQRMQRYIDEALGKGAWAQITLGGAPKAGMDDVTLSLATAPMLAAFDAQADDATANRVFSMVRHGLSAADFTWAREKFLEYGDIDAFAEATYQEQMADLREYMQNGSLFYGQPITPEVYAHVSQIEDLFYGRRHGNKILATAIPYQAQEFLAATDPKHKRYTLCHCQFARESILGAAPVSRTICYCSLGHNLMFWEAALDTELTGEVLESALGGDLACRFSITLPPAVMEKYLRH